MKPGATFAGGGFLGTAAPLLADLTILVELAMGVALLAGAMLARCRRYHAHACCQTAVVLLNLVVIAAAMAPSFRRQVSGRIPARLNHSYYAVATTHAALGTAAELLGLYVLIVSGTNILPERLRFRRYRAWMRTALALWWTGLLLGFATYARWYIIPLVGR